MNAHIMKAVMQSHTDELRRYAKTRRVGEGDRVGRFTVAH
jgi:hypothetical protein